MTIDEDWYQMLRYRNRRQGRVGSYYIAIYLVVFGKVAHEIWEEKSFYEYATMPYELGKVTGNLISIKAPPRLLGCERLQCAP
jgi:hypothetical protein